MARRSFLRDLGAAVVRTALAQVAKAVSPEDEQQQAAAAPPPPPAPAPAPEPAPAVQQAAPDTNPLDIQVMREAIPRTPEALDALLDFTSATRDPKSLLYDPFSVIDSLGFKDKPSSLTYTTLRSMAWTPIVRAIIVHRKRQVQNFAVRQVDKFTPGFRISQVNKKAAPTPETERRSQQIEQWLMTTGFTNNPAGRDNFATFLGKLVEDRLTYDQTTFEIVPSRLGTPANFLAVDAASMRLADTTKLWIDPEDRQIIRYVQVYDGLVVAEYNSDELCFGIHNATTTLQNQGYGQSELEMLIQTITAMLWSWDYNQKYFSQGTSAKGIINFKGAVPDKQLKQFRQFWYAQTAGIDNAFRTPIVNADDMQWLSMQESNKDMEFSAWMDFLIKVTCAIYGLDPMEINFKYGDSGGAKSMFESANLSKLTASKDKGLKPLLLFIQGLINQHLIKPMAPDMEFEFVGLDASTPAEQAELIGKQTKSYKTINEARKEEDLPPLPDGSGDIICDPVYMQHLVAMSGQQAQPAPGMDPGDPPTIPEDGISPPPDFAKSRRKPVVVDLKL